MANADFFVKIDGIDGESPDDKHSGWIAVRDLSWEVSQASSTQGTSTGRGAGRATPGNFHFVAVMSKASSKLRLACDDGTHIKTVVISGCKAGGGAQEFLKITLGDVLVAKYRIDMLRDGAEVLPVDIFDLNFATIEQEYKEQKADGSLGAAVKTGFDYSKNKKM
jgi:type VI secretion system secreted protein Hcp